MANDLTFSRYQAKKHRNANHRKTFAEAARELQLQIEEFQRREMQTQTPWWLLKY